jgi:hypothetical protein
MTSSVILSRNGGEGSPADARKPLRRLGILRSTRDDTFVGRLRALWPFGRHMVIPERRRHRRYLTLKNAALAAVALVVAFTLLSLWSARRPPHSGTSWFEPRTSSEPISVDREPFPAVQEGSVQDYPRVDSILLDGETAPAVGVPAAPSPVPAAQQKIEPREPQPQLGKGQRITISGGAAGVQVHTAPAPAPLPH